MNSVHPPIRALLVASIALFALLGASSAEAICFQGPQIGDQTPDTSIHAVVGDASIEIFYEDWCWGEVETVVEYREFPDLAWNVFHTDVGSVSGWRSVEHSLLDESTAYCYRVTVVSGGGSSRTSQEVCHVTHGPSTLDLVANSALPCGAPPNNPSSTDEREHVYLSEVQAMALGIDVANVQLSGPSPQVRMIVDTPLLPGGDTSTAAYTVARICPAGGTKEAWVWNTDRLFPAGAPVLATVELTFEPMAPSETAGLPGGTQQHFGEPVQVTAGTKEMVENVVIEADKRVALLVPHGGSIELNTSDQIDDFVTEVENLGDFTDHIPVNVWEVEGRWGSGETFDRWHITSGDIHPDGFPGLDALLSEPLFDPLTGQHFQYAVALHGFSDNTDLGIILGGLADRDLRCHVAATIQNEAAARSGEIGFHIANAATGGGDILVQNSRAYVPAPANVQHLEGQSVQNIVNWVSQARQFGLSSWGGIQLEQSTCLRREYNCANGSNLCTNNEPDCMHNVVARGVARALEEVLEDDTVDDGACCVHYGECP